jgi:hypothetical protein
VRQQQPLEGRMIARHGLRQQLFAMIQLKSEGIRFHRSTPATEQQQSQLAKALRTIF